MLVKIILVAFLFLGIGAFVFAEDGDHSADVCSSVNAVVCAHLGHMSKLNSTDEVQFVAHVMTPDEEQISDLTIDLWFGDDKGHGSLPVAIKQFGTNKYKVTKAYFAARGEWLVRLNFNLNGVNHQINVPVVVE